MEGRDENGRFKKGTSGNPNGRPKRNVEDKYLRALVRVVSLKDWEKILDVGVSRAKSGDIAWVKFLAEYLLGKPIQRQEHSGPRGKPIEHDVIVYDTSPTDEIRSRLARIRDRERERANPNEPDGEPG